MPNLKQFLYLIQTRSTTLKMPINLKSIHKFNTQKWNENSEKHISIQMSYRMFYRINIFVTTVSYLIVKNKWAKFDYKILSFMYNLFLSKVTSCI
jgi:hypothetical protein